MAYTHKQVGEPGTLESKVYILSGDHVVSPLHDIPLWADKEKSIANMIFEIPKGTNAKLEIATKEYFNPIKQDTKDGKLRFIHDPYPFNYGAFPQTYESPFFVHPATQAKGDNDPLDAADIGVRIAHTGEVRQVKILGVWAMIDAGETDWKVLVIDVTDPLAASLNDIDDLKHLAPEKIANTFTFLRDYKIPDGKGPNKFAFEGELKNKQFALEIIEECHQQWRDLLHRAESPLSRVHTTEGFPGKISHDEVKHKLGW